MVNFLFVNICFLPRRGASFSHAKRCQHRPRGPRWPQEGPKKAPRWPQDGPKRTQDGPKMAPRRPQDGPKRAQDSPRGPKMDPRDPKVAPTWPQGQIWAALGPLGRPKILSKTYPNLCSRRSRWQNAHLWKFVSRLDGVPVLAMTNDAKRGHEAPRWPQEAPRWPQEAPRWP